MTEAEKKALALYRVRALCRLSEQLEAERIAHAATKAEAEAFRREVSDAVEAYAGTEPHLGRFNDTIGRFILPKPDPLVEVFEEIHGHQLREGETWPQSIAQRLRAALATRGLEVRKIGEGE